ncbi:hypothetical protein RJ640_025790 [Escallonia rubra]|uniref:GH18 domain-containing protein n=1 Tax=Escallonia rubra TaxID=112253 RepID=A0AA88UUK7_9ASTE|nr:hypothetical protein RJ640_025790 [Escallonia rubra]
MRITSLMILLVLVIVTDDCHFVSPSTPSVFIESALTPSIELSPGPSPSLTPAPAPSPSAPSQGIKAAYWPSFTGYPASFIDTSYFSHIYFAFILPSPTTYELNVTSFHQEKISEFMDALHARNPPVKTILSIGGAGNDPSVFSQIVSNELTRAIFINSTIEVAREYGFDGVDLDWEFPINELDMSNLGLLFMQWRQALEYESKVTNKPRLLLTSAVYYASIVFLYAPPPSYPGDIIGNYVDWISPMCFDYCASSNPITGEHAALYDPKSNNSTSFGIQSWIQANVPPEKIVMGMPLYGKTWTLQDPNVNGVGAPAVGAGPGDGILVYSQIVEFNSENNATVVFDEQFVASYSYAGDSWIGYDDVRSIKVKAQFAQSRSLGGYFFWALGQDEDWTISRAGKCSNNPIFKI